MNELLYEFDDKRGKLWPDLIGHKSRMIIFEDLKQSDFKVTDCTKCHDFEQSKLVVRSLARFHAMSKMLLERGSISSKDIPRYPLLADLNVVDKMYRNSLKLLVDEINTWGDEWTDICERLLKFSDAVAEKIMALTNISEDNFNVINHGDCWVNNIMFKYHPYENLPVDLRFIDFQLFNYQSYGWDLVLYLYSSLLGDCRRKHYDELITAYQQSLKESLLLYKYPENRIPTLTDVNKEMERLNVFAVVICTVTHPMMTAPVKKPFSMDECLLACDYKHCGYNPDIFRGRYKHEIAPDIRRFAEIGIY